MSATCDRSVAFSTNKTDPYDITEILLKVAFNKPSIVNVTPFHKNASY
jgi:hypothetical protein